MLINLCVKKDLSVSILVTYNRCSNGMYFLNSLNKNFKWQILNILICGTLCGYQYWHIDTQRYSKQNA